MADKIITNWDKVKEETDINEDYSFVNCVCNAIKRIRNIKDCDEIPTCRECQDWLKQPYKEPILDEAEKKYLSAVIRPFRNRTNFVKKNVQGGSECIYIDLEGDVLMLPLFERNTMYKGMELNKRYTLDDLEI